MGSFPKKQHPCKKKAPLGPFFFAPSNYITVKRPKNGKSQSYNYWLSFIFKIALSYSSTLV